MGNHFFKKTLKYPKHFFYCFYSFCSDRKVIFYDIEQKSIEKKSMKEKILAFISQDIQKIETKIEKNIKKKRILSLLKRSIEEKDKNNEESENTSLFHEPESNYSKKKLDRQKTKRSSHFNEQRNDHINEISDVLGEAYSQTEDKSLTVLEKFMKSALEKKKNLKKKKQKKTNQTTDNLELEIIDEQNSPREPSDQDTKIHGENTSSSLKISQFMNQKEKTKTKNTNNPTKIFVTRSNSIDPTNPNKINHIETNKYDMRSQNMPRRVEERQIELENRPRQMTVIDIYSPNQKQKTNQKLQGRLLDNSKQKTTNEKKKPNILELYLVPTPQIISPQKLEYERAENLEQGSQKISLRCPPQKERLQKSGKKIGFENKPSPKTTKNSPQRYSYLEKKYNLRETPKKKNEFLNSITEQTRSRNRSTSRQTKTYTFNNNESLQTENLKSKQLKKYNKQSMFLKQNIAHWPLQMQNNQFNKFSMPKKSVDSDSTRPIKSFVSFSNSHISKK